MWSRFAVFFLCLAPGTWAADGVVRRATTTEGPTPAGPTQTGTVANCNKWYTVQSNDNCNLVETAFKITHAQFIQWNPSVSQDCITNFWPTYSYCVGVGAAVTTSSSTKPTSTKPTSTSSTKVTTSSSVTTKSSSTSLTTTSVVNSTYSIANPIKTWNVTNPTIVSAFPPSPTKSGQPVYCSNWHLATPVDTCDRLVSLYSSTMNMNDLLSWNPTLGTDCSGLFVNWWVCVGIQYQSSITLSYATGNATIPPPALLTPTPNPTINSSFVASPVQTGVVSGCQGFYKAQNGDTCPKVIAQFSYLTQAQFIAWNPAVGSSCAMLQDYYYCIASFPSTSPPMPPTITASATPTQSRSISTCTAWYLTTISDTCDIISAMFGTFATTDFIAWNPSVFSDCTGIQMNYYYCVAVPSTPKTRTAPLPTSTFASDNPKQTGIIANCTSFWVVGQSDTCDTISLFNGITLGTFFALNPAVGTGNSTINCVNLIPDYAVCVGVTAKPVSTTGGSAPTSTTPTTTTKPPTTTTVPPPTTTSGNGMATPQPTQSGMISSCIRFYYVNSGQGCWDIANEAGITLANFYLWNTAAAPDCSGMWAKVWVCVGISGGGGSSGTISHSATATP